ncbi:MAG: DUF58 domain-containing protein [Lachnospiraceae bacterium]|nr:DUF58 domain-containing protein [Lachnospiraceae bacterium]
MIFNNEFFESLKKLSLPSVTAGPVSESGGKRSRVKGRGSEFSDYREYAFGDDIRMLDWNAYGRLNKLYIKRFLEEREVTCHILVDVSKSMRLEKEKYIKALQLSGVVAYMALSAGDRVRVIFYKDGFGKMICECFGVSGFYKALGRIESEAEKDTEYKDSIAGLIRPSGLSAIISDFYPEQGLDLKYLHFYKKQELIFFQTFGKSEIDPEIKGVSNLTDAENDGKVKVSLIPKILKEYKKRFKAFTEETAKKAEKLSGSYITVDTSDPLKVIVNKGTGITFR